MVMIPLASLGSIQPLSSWPDEPDPLAPSALAIAQKLLGRVGTGPPPDPWPTFATRTAPDIGMVTSNTPNFAAALSHRPLFNGFRQRDWAPIAVTCWYLRPHLDWPPLHVWQRADGSFTAYYRTNRRMVSAARLLELTEINCEIRTG